MKLTKTKLRQIIKEEFQRAIKESSYKTVNAQLDQLEDIVATGVEKQQGLMSIAVALKDEGFRDASVDDGALTFTGDDGELYAVAKPGRVDLAGDVTAREIGPYVLGVIGGDEEEDEDPRSSLGGMIDVDYDDPIKAPIPRGLEERKITKSKLKQIIKEEFDAHLREAELGPEYNIPLKIGLGTYNIFQQYWEGQGDPLYALLSRRGDTPSFPVVNASEEEVERLGDVAEEIIEANEDPGHVRVAEKTLEDIKKAARSDMLPKLQQDPMGRGPGTSDLRKTVMNK